MSEMYEDKETGFDVIHAGGEPRLLSLTPPKPATLMAIPTFMSRNDVIPRAQWKPTNRLQTLGSKIPRYNQGQVGKCEPTSEVECFSGCRASAGLPMLRFSTGYAYALVNNGRDQGAGMGDVYAALMRSDRGFCLEPTMPGGFYGPNQVTQQAVTEGKLYRPREGYHGQTFADIASAILNDAWPNVGVRVGSNFNNLDSRGCVPVTRGTPNHAIGGIDLVSLGTDEWGILCFNHWGLQWGMTGIYAGMCVVSERAYDATSYQDSIIYQGVTIDADTPLPPSP